MNPEYNLFIKWGRYNYWIHKSVTILCKVRITYIIHLLTSEIFSFALGALLTDGMDEEVEKCCCVVGTTGGIIRTSCDRCWLVRLLLGTRPSLKLHNYGSFLTTVVCAAQISNYQHQSNHHKPCHFVCAVLVSKLSTSISPLQIMSVCQQRHATIQMQVLCHSSYPGWTTQSCKSCFRNYGSHCLSACWKQHAPDDSMHISRNRYLLICTTVCNNRILLENSSGKTQWLAMSISHSCFHLNLSHKLLTLRLARMTV